jgi:hypothetical protein
VGRFTLESSRNEQPAGSATFGRNGVSEEDDSYDDIPPTRKTNGHGAVYGYQHEESIGMRH